MRAKYSAMHADDELIEEEPTELIAKPKVMERRSSLVQFAMNKGKYDTQSNLAERMALHVLFKSYKEMHGPNFMEKLNWDECNLLLKSLNHNKYPNLVSMGRP